MKKITILGASGHGKAVAEIAKLNVGIGKGTVVMAGTGGRYKPTVAIRKKSLTSPSVVAWQLRREA